MKFNRKEREVRKAKNVNQKKYKETAGRKATLLSLDTNR